MKLLLFIAVVVLSANASVMGPNIPEVFLPKSEQATGCDVGRLHYCSFKLYGILKTFFIN